MFVMQQGQVVMEAVESGVPAGSMMAQSVMQNSMMQGSYASSVKSPSQMRFGSSNLVRLGLYVVGLRNILT